MKFFRGVTAEFYGRIGYTLLTKAGDAAKEKEAARWFKKAAEAYDAELQLLNDPIKVTANALEIPRVKLRKAEMQMMIKDYDAAIVTLTAIWPRTRTARFRCCTAPCRNCRPAPAGSSPPGRIIWPTWK